MAPNKAIKLKLQLAITSKPIAAINDNRERIKRFIRRLFYQLVLMQSHFFLRIEC